jgi:two-component system LytT family sensor kinase
MDQKTTRLWRRIGKDVLICQGIGLTIALTLHLYGRVSPFRYTLAISLIFSNFNWGCVHLLAILARHRWRENRHWDIAFIVKSVFVFFLGLTAGLEIGNFVTGALLKRVFIPFLSLWHLYIILLNLGASIFAVTVIALYKNLKYRLERRDREYMELENLQVKTRLAALQAKLNPHFLFNTLNVILDLANQAPEKIETVVLNLSDIYRTVLGQGENEKSTLGNEIGLVRKYLEIERMRLGKRLRYTIDWDERLAGQPLPPLLIEPLVENAVIHGICPKAAGGEITLSAHAADDRLRIEIADDGVGIPPHTDKGFGLHSVRERLQLIYGQTAAMTITTAAGSGTRICLEVPLAS